MLRKIMIQGLLAMALVLVHFGTASAGDEAAPPISDRTHLLGDWGGARTALAANGIIVDLETTQFYQGVVSGSSGTNNGQYGGKGDLFVTLIGEKLGLWKGFLVNMHLEGRFGDDVNALSGLSPANASMLMPNSDDTVALTQLSAIQMLSPEIALTAGKFNALDFVNMAFHTGRGIDGFMNASMVMPIGLGGTVPLGIRGGGIMKFKGKEVQGALLAYDPNNCATTSCLDHPFQDVAGVAMWKFFTGIGPDGKDAGFIAVGATYSGKQYTIIDRHSLAVIPGEGLVFTDTDTSWSIFSVVNQQLWADASNPDRTLSFKGNYSISDGKPNPLKWSATAALELTAPLPGRDKDVFGIGYFHTQLSSSFKDLVGPALSILEGTEIRIEDTDGFEAYYKAQLTPWLAVTGDLQVISETLSNTDRKIVAGVRAKVTY